MRRRYLGKSMSNLRIVLPSFNPRFIPACRLYLVNCIQTKRPEKAREFFERLGGELQGSSDWKEWFALPFVPNPETNPAFAGYFSRQWQDTLMLTLFNFMSIVYASLPPPRLADYRKGSLVI